MAGFGRRDCGGQIERGPDVGQTWARRRWVPPASGAGCGGQCYLRFSGVGWRHPGTGIRRHRPAPCLEPWPASFTGPSQRPGPVKMLWKPRPGFADEGKYPAQMFQEPGFRQAGVAGGNRINEALMLNEDLPQILDT